MLGFRVVCNRVLTDALAANCTLTCFQSESIASIEDFNACTHPVKSARLDANCCATSPKLSLIFSACVSNRPLGQATPRSL